VQAQASRHVQWSPWCAAVPALFTVGWLAAGAGWLLQTRLERALVAILVAAVAASFGMRIAIASRR